MRSKTLRYSLVVFISGLCLLEFARSTEEHVIGKLKINDNEKGNGLNVVFDGFNAPLTIHLGHLGGSFHQNKTGPSSVQYTSTRASQVEIRQEAAPINHATVTCHTFRWPNPPSDLEDCISLGDSMWFGGGELRFQHWPISLSHPRFPYVTGDFFHHPYGGLIERLWFDSNGYSIEVDPDTPLFLRFNNSGDGLMCFSASYDEYPYTPGEIKTAKELKYTICSAPDVRKITDYALQNYIRKPRAMIDDRILSDPIWSTWAKYKADINQTSVLDFAKEIHENGFSASHVEVDDKWETCYGDLQFDLKKFPEPAAMIQKLKDMGFGVSFWVHPFTNSDCTTFKNGADKGYFVKNVTSGEPLLTTWWNGVGGYLDMTNKEAVDSMADRLKRLQEQYGIDTYKFDAGEVHWNEPGFAFTDKTVMKNPNEFTRLYTNLASRFGNGVEVRVAYKSQDLPIFFRMLDKDSKWDYDNGLKTLIPTSLLFSALGYPFILPDMIGGNNYGTDSSVPDRELFIRWLQLNAFLPALQFSIAPWDYDKETTELTKRYIKLHQDYVPLMKTLGEESVRTGKPIIRPLWWNDPLDKVALAMDSEFLVGDSLLVAPILDKGARSRDIYLPKGTWKDMIQNTSYIGSKWIRNYNVTLEQIPYFTKQP